MHPQRQLSSSPLINVMVAAIEKAGRAIVRDFGEIEQLQVSRKSLGDFVSTADKKIRAYPDPGITKSTSRFFLLVGRRRRNPRD